MPEPASNSSGVPLPVSRVISSLDELPTFEPGETIDVDVETVSYDDYKFGTAFDGKSAVCGYAVVDSKLNGYYLPIRHRSKVGGENLPLEPVQEWLRSWMNDGRDIVNHNIKFDARYWRQDGIEVKGSLLDTIVLARLIDCDRLSYKLDSLARDYLGEKKDTDLIKGYLSSIKVKGGKALSLALKSEDYILPLVPQMISIGEQSGGIDAMLGKAATFYENELDQTIKSISTLIEPIMMVALAGVAGVMIGAVLFPIYALVGNGAIR